MKSNNIILHRFCFLVILCFYSLSAVTSASTIGEYQTIEDIARSVNVENMMKTVSDLQENKDVKSPDISYKSRYCLRVNDASDPTDGACDNSAKYIYNRFASYGLDVEYDPFIHTVTTKKDDKTTTLNSYEMRNVVATLHGKGPHSNKTYVVCSHYDSIAGLSAGWLWNWKSLPAPGADDNASGTSAVIEIARILSHYDFDFTIKFIAFSGEELGMFGSKHYAQDSSVLGHQISGVIDLDMIGYDSNELDIAVITNNSSEWIANAISHIQKEYGIDLAVSKVINPKMIYSDHSPFWKSGNNAVLVTEANDSSSDEFSPVNHSPNDTLDKLNPELILRTSKLIIATLAMLANPIVEPDNIINTDLAINSDSVTTSQTSSKPRSTINVNAYVKNEGNEDAMNVTAQIWLSPPETWLSPKLLKELKIDIKAGSLCEINETIPLSNWGDYDVIVKINPDFNIFESDYTNNMVHRVIKVSAELGISDLLIYPNPLYVSKYSELNIRYRLSQDAYVTFSVYDILGNLIFREDFNPGENGGQRGPNNNIKWNTDSLSQGDSSKQTASGIYICRVTMMDLKGEQQSVSGKIALLR
jgi:hypothetical protein